MVDLENELKMIGENMKSLEVAEEKALTREEKYQVFLFDGGTVSWLLIGSNMLSIKYSHWTAE